MKTIYATSMRVCPICKQEPEFMLDHLEEHLRNGDLEDVEILVPYGKEWIKMGIPGMLDKDEKDKP